MSTTIPAGSRHSIFGRFYKILFLSSFRLWYTTCFLRGFCYYWPLLVLFLLPLGMMAGALGGRFGPKFLFFHDHPLKQFVAGIAVALHWAAVLFVAYLLSLRDRRDADDTTLPLRVPQGFLPYALALVVCLFVTALGGIVILGACIASFRVLAAPTAPDQVTGIEAYEADIRQGEVRQEAAPAEPGAVESPPVEADSLPPASSTMHFDYLAAGALLTWGIMGIMGVVVKRLSPRKVGVSRRSWLGRFKRWQVQQRRRLRQTPVGATAGIRVRVRPVLRWVMSLATVLVWVAILVQLVKGDAHGMRQYEASIAFTTVGLLMTVLSVVFPNRSSFFSAAFAANIVLLLAGVSYALSSCPWGAVAAIIVALGGAAFLGTLLWAIFRNQWTSAKAAALGAALALARRERNAVAVGLVGLLLFPVVLAVQGFVRYFSSPVPLILLLLFGVVAGYGLVAYAVRRSMPVLVACIVLLAFVSNVQKYRARFPVLEDEPIIHLVEETGRDIGRQKAFNLKLEEYRKKRDELESMTGKDAAEDLAKLDRLRKEKVTLEEELRTQWGQLEDRNKTRAGRLREPDPSRPLIKDLNLYYGRTEGDALLVARLADDGRNRDNDLQAWPKLPEENRPLVVIVVSGGGSRAAVWTFAVLKELELAFAQGDPPVDFPSHVRIITGASGGIVGASYYVATLPHPDQRPAPDKRRIDLNKQQEWLGSDFLTPIFKRGVLSDIPCLLSPWPMRYDRGRALEQAWSDCLKPPPSTGLKSGALDISFESLREGEKAGWRPSLAISPMMIEDGRRLIVSNLDMRYAISNDGTVLTQNGPGGGFQNHSIEAMELFRLFPDARKRFTVATAARMSASFPYFSPAVSLPTEPRRRVVDAGYYDNYGVSLASSWLFSGNNQDWILKHFKRILIIQIRDGITEDRRQLLEHEPDNSSIPRRAVEELTSPPEGLYNASTSSSSFRNDGQLELLDEFEHLRRKVSRPANWKDSPILVVDFELGDEVSLSWYLSNQENDKINTDAAELTSQKKGWRLEELKSWWFRPALKTETNP
jgi:hypothetical protein